MSNYYFSEFEVRNKLHALQHEAHLTGLLKALYSAMDSKQKKPEQAPAAVYAYRPQDAVCMNCH